MDQEKDVIAPAPVDTTPDLDKLRDEKCIPIAQELLKEFSTSLLPDSAEKIDFNPVILNVLQKSLDADLNITTEASYIFQLVLGAYSGLNATTQKATLSPVDDARYNAIGRKMLTLVADANVRMNNVTPEETEKDFAGVLSQLNALFVEENINRLELKYIMDNILTSLNFVQNGVQESLVRSSAKAEAKLFGIESMDDLTMKRLQEVLLSPSPEAPKE